MLARKLLFVTKVTPVPDIVIANATTKDWWFGTLNKNGGLDWDNKGAILDFTTGYYEGMTIDPDDGIWFIAKSTPISTLYNIDKNGTPRVVHTFSTSYNVSSAPRITKYKNIIVVEISTSGSNYKIFYSKDKGVTWYTANPINNTSSNSKLVITNGNWWLVSQQAGSQYYSGITQDFATFYPVSRRSSGDLFVLSPDGAPVVWHLNASGIDRTAPVSGTGYTQIYSGQAFEYGGYIGGGYVTGNQGTALAGKVGLFGDSSFSPSNITLSSQNHKGAPISSYLNPGLGPILSRGSYTNTASVRKYSATTASTAALVNFTNSQSTGSNVSFGFSEKVAFICGSSASLLMVGDEQTFTKPAFFPTQATNTRDVIAVKNDIQKIHKRKYD